MNVKRRKNLLGLITCAVLLAVTTISLSACSSSTSQVNPSQVNPSGAKIRVVTSTAVWGSVASAIAGDKAVITSIVSNPNQDPHSFEASVRDQAAVNNADLIFVTGNGYDSFMNPLVAASNQPASHVIALAPKDKTVKPAYGHAVNDPHVWYDFDIVSRVAQQITSTLSKADPADAATFNHGGNAFQDGLAQLKNRLTKASYRYTCATAQFPTSQPCKNLALTSILQPESVGLRLIKDFAVDLTPQTVRQAVMNGNDISVQDMALMKTFFFGKIVNGSLGFAANTPVDWLVLNSQQAGPQLSQLTAWAKQNQMTTILSFSESLPAGKTYLTWMSDNVAQIETQRETEAVL